MRLLAEIIRDFGGLLVYIAVVTILFIIGASYIEHTLHSLGL